MSFISKLTSGFLLISCLLHGCHDTQRKQEIGYDPLLLSSKDILRQAVTLNLELGSKNVVGQQQTEFRVTSRSEALTFDTGDFTIVSATINGQPLPEWSSTNGKTGFNLSKPLDVGVSHVLAVNYTAKVKRGFRSDSDILYTGYFACDWMICDQEAFDDRFTMDLQIIAPSGLSTLGPGRQVSTKSLPNSQETHHWKTAMAFPAYLNAFALGDFISADMSGDCTTEIFVTQLATSDPVNHLFADSCAMLSFFEGKSNIAFPFARYVQLYAPNSGAAQEAVSHSILGSKTIDPMRQDPSEDWAVAHELAHQWWGNQITAASLQDFWLNEGLVTFMVASWKEHRWGRASYDAEIGLARSRWKKAVERWQDVPLAYEGAYPSIGIRRSIQYSKATVFLDTLRRTIGEDAFWLGISDFTKRNWGASVTSADFQTSMEKTSGKNLDIIFKEWVTHRGE